METVKSLLTLITRRLPPPEGCHHVVHLGPENRLAITLNIDGQMQSFFFEPEDLELPANKLAADLEAAWRAQVGP